MRTCRAWGMSVEEAHEKWRLAEYAQGRVFAWHDQHYLDSDSGVESEPNLADVDFSHIPDGPFRAKERVAKPPRATPGVSKKRQKRSRPAINDDLFGGEYVPLADPHQPVKRGYGALRIPSPPLRTPPPEQPVEAIEMVEFPAAIVVQPASFRQRDGRTPTGVQEELYHSQSDLLPTDAGCCDRVRAAFNDFLDPHPNDVVRCPDCPPPCSLVNTLVRTLGEALGCGYQQEGLGNIFPVKDVTTLLDRVENLVKEGNTVEKLNDLLDKYEQVSDHTMDRAETLLRSGNSLDRMENLMGRAESLSTRVANTGILSENDKKFILDLLYDLQTKGVSVSATSAKLSMLEVGLSVIVCIILLILSPSKTAAACVILFGMLCGGAFTRIFNWIKEVIPEVRDLKAYAVGLQQQSASSSLIVAPLARLISTGVVALSSSGDTRKLPTYVKAQQVASSFNSITTMSEAVTKAIDYAHEVLWEAETGLPFAFSQNSELMLELSSWLDLVDSTVRSPTWISDIPNTPDSFDILQDLQEVGADLFKKCQLGQGEIKQHALIVTEALTSVKQVAKAAQSLKACTKARPVPVFVVLLGDTGIGKTHMIESLAVELYQKLSKTERCIRYPKWEDLVFMKSPGSQYSDGYHGHLVYVMDELFHSNDPNVRAKDITDVLTYISPAPVPVDIAVAEFKNSIPFNSPYVVATTNLQHWSSIDAVSPEALMGRRDFVVRPVIKTAFARTYIDSSGASKIQLDVAKWQTHCAANNLDSSIPDYANYQLFDRFDESKLLKTIDFKTLVKEIAKVKDAKQNVSEQKITSIKERFNRYQQQGLTTLEAIRNRIKDQATVAQFSALRGLDKLPVEVVLPLFVTEDDITNCIPSTSTTTDKFTWLRGAHHIAYDHCPAINTIKAAWTPLSKESQTYLYVALGGMFKLPDASRGGFLKAICTGEHVNAELSGFHQAISNLPMTKISRDEYYKIMVDIGCPLRTLKEAFVLSVRSIIESFKFKNTFIFLGAVSVAVGLLAAAGFSVHYLVKKFSKDKSESKFNVAKPKDNTTESWSSTDKSEKKPKFVNKWSESLNTILGSDECQKQYEQQALHDKNWESQFDNVRAALYLAEIVSVTGEVMNKTCGLLVCPDYLLLPSHLFANVIDGFKLNLYGKIHKLSIDISTIVRHSIGNRWDFDDVTLCNIRNLPGKSIVNLFATADEIRSLTDCFGEMLLIRNGEIMRCSSAIRSQSTVEERHLQVTPTLRAITGWHYVVPSQKGDCGAPLIRWDPSTNGKIIGIHAAANGSSVFPNLGCFACIVDKDWILSIVGKLEQHGDAFEDPAYVSDGMVVTKLVDKSEIIHVSNVSSIRPSILQPILGWESKSLPARCTRENVDKALQSYPTNVSSIDRIKLDNVSRRTYYQYYMNRPMMVRPRYTLNEALNIMGTVESVNAQSSMGFPWVLEKITKKDVLVYDEETGFRALPQLLEFMEKYENSILDDKPLDVIWSVYLKDERLPIEKVLDGKIRLFSASPFHFTLLCRQYYSDFLNHLRRYSFDSGIMIGIDPHSQWFDLYRRIVSSSKTVLAADFKNWDKALPVELVDLFFQWAEIFYQHPCVVRDYIRSVITSPTYQFKGVRFMSIAGNPSGCAFTAEINSVANLVLNKFVLDQVLTKEASMNAYIVTYGDDLVVCSPEFDTEKYMDIMTSVGLRVTASDKTNNLKFEKIEEISFLCRKFVRVPNNVLAPLPLDTLKDSLLWIGKKSRHNEFSIVEDTVRNFMLEMQHQPLNSEIYMQVLGACQKLSINVPITDHCLNSLNTLESMDGSFTQKLIFLAAGHYWNHCLAPEKKPIPSKYIIKDLVVDYVGVDLARYLPTVPLGIFYHVGFRIDGVEITFSDKGPCIVEPSYTPDFTEFNVQVNIVEGIKIGKVRYQRINRNCIWWCETLLGRNEKHKKLIEWSDKHATWMQQGDDGLAKTEGASKEVSVGIVTKSSSHLKALPGCTRTVSQAVQTEEVVAKGEWSTQTIGTEIASVELPSALYTIDQIADKLRYNTLLVGDLEMEFQCNTMQFMAGSLLVVWEPMAVFGPPDGQKPNVYGYTGMPHAIFNASTANRVQLKIPFTHPQLALSLVNQTTLDNLGTLRVMVRSPLRAGASAGTVSVSYKILAHLKNIRTLYPTPMQFGSNIVTRTVNASIYPRWQLQANEAEEKSERGVISGVAEKTAEVATMLSGIPVISGFMGVVATVSATVGTVARALGLSKPRSVAATTPMIPRPFTNVSHRDGLDMSIPLSNDPLNSVSIIPSYFGSGVDELNIPYIIRTPVCIGALEWSAVTPADKILASFPVHPFVSFASGNEASGVSLQTSYMGYVACVFKYWRGSINWTIEVIGTSFHKGALVVDFIPFGTNKDDANYSLANTVHYKFNLTESHELKFKTDYVSPRPYQLVGSPYLTTIDDDKAIGTVNIRVFNKLTFTEAVANKVQVNIWVSAGHDFAFAFPTMELIPSLGYGTSRPASNDVSDWELEGDTEVSPCCVSPVNARFVDSHPSFACMATDSDPMIDMVMGETVENLRDVLKVFTLKHESTMTTESSITFPTHRFNTNQEDRAEDTFYDHLMRIFRFSRGSIRYKIVTSPFPGTMTASLKIANDTPYIWQKSSSKIGNPWAMAVPSLNPTLEISVPYYSDRKMVVHGSASNNRQVQVDMKVFDSTTPKVQVYEAVGDDFSAGYLYALPLLFSKPISTDPMWDEFSSWANLVPARDCTFAISAKKVTITYTGAISLSLVTGLVQGWKASEFFVPTPYSKVECAAVLTLPGNADITELFVAPVRYKQNFTVDFFIGGYVTGPSFYCMPLRMIAENGRTTINLLRGWAGGLKVKMIVTDFDHRLEFAHFMEAPYSTVTGKATGSYA
ncbi:putative polyprotein [Freshwater macrophyte associated picorna-like virus 14]|nr:putative polyprotein [Freshwater macrophyte associated picorna-like virus 14]